MEQTAVGVDYSPMCALEQDMEEDNTLITRIVEQGQ